MISDWVLNFEKSPTSPMRPATEITPSPLIERSRAAAGDTFQSEHHLGFYLCNEPLHDLQLSDDVLYVQDDPGHSFLDPDRMPSCS